MSYPAQAHNRRNRERLRFHCVLPVKLDTPDLDTSGPNDSPIEPITRAKLIVLSSGMVEVDAHHRSLVRFLQIQQKPRREDSYHATMHTLEGVGNKYEVRTAR